MRPSCIRRSIGNVSSSIDEITTFPLNLREELMAQGYVIGLPEIVQAARSVDGTERYLIRLSDGETVETVWMPDGDGGERGDGSEAATDEEREDALATNPVAAAGYRRSTICVSSQVGCAVNCQFCLTAKLGGKAKSYGGRDRGSGCGGSKSPQRRAWKLAWESDAGSYQPCLLWAWASPS